MTLSYSATTALSHDQACGDYIKQNGTNALMQQLINSTCIELMSQPIKHQISAYCRLKHKIILERSRNPLSINSTVVTVSGRFLSEHACLPLHYID